MPTARKSNKTAAKKKTRKASTPKPFYMVAKEEDGFYMPVNDDLLNVPLRSKSFIKVKEMRDGQRKSENLRIVKCSVLKS